MIAVLVVVGVALLLGIGFYLTRGAGGPPPLSGEGRMADTTWGVGPLGERIPRAGEALEPPGQSDETR